MTDDTAPMVDDQPPAAPDDEPAAAPADDEVASPVEAAVARTIHAPNKAFNGVGAGGVVFTDGVARTSDPTAIQYFRDAGFGIDEEAPAARLESRATPACTPSRSPWGRTPRRRRRPPAAGFSATDQRRAGGSARPARRGAGPARCRASTDPPG